MNTNKKKYTLDCPTCGKERTFSTKWGMNDSKKNNRSCHECSMLYRNNGRKYFISQTFEKWTIIDRYKKDGVVWWKVKCECGNIFKRNSIANMVNGGSTQCTECQYESMRSNYNPEEVSNRQFYKLNQSAKKRGILFKVEQKELSELYINQNKLCNLSGLDITLPAHKGEMDSYSFTASLDRIDSKEGYITGNVQWIHKEINIMKNSLSQERFIYLCQQITKHN